MSQSDLPLSDVSGPQVRRVFAGWALAGALGVAGVARVLTLPDPSPELTPVLAAVAVYGVGTALALALLRRGFAHPTLGLCNIVTLLRLVLTAALVAPLVTPAEVSGWAIFAVAALALTLDGADGWLARRHRRASEFGARFDMEVDSALGLILALNAFAAGTAGALVLLVGMPRYVFAGAGLVLPWLDRPLPERFSRKAVCVAQIGALIALQPPLLPLWIANPLVAAVALMLLWSFWRDVHWLWRHRA